MKHKWSKILLLTIFSKRIIKKLLFIARGYFNCNCKWNN